MSISINPRVKNIIALAGSKLLHPFFSFFLIRTISNELGVKGQGNYSTVFGFLLIFEVIASFGMRTLIVREVAQDREKGAAYFYHALWIALPIAVLCILAMNGAALLPDYEPIITQGLWILSVSLLATAVTDCAEGVLIGYEKIQAIGTIQVLTNMVRVAVSLSLIFAGYSLITVFWVHLFYKLSILIAYWILLRKQWQGGRVPLDRPFLKELFNTAKTFALILVFVTMYWRTDILMLSAMKGSEAVGIYDGAYRYFGIILIVVSNFVVSLFPVISQKFKLGRHQFEYVTRKMAKYFLLLALPGVTLLILLSHFLIVGIFNHDMAASVVVLQILALVIIPYGLTEIISHVFIASGNQALDLKVNGLGLLCNVLLNALLIPRFSYTGAAIASLLSILLYLGLQTFFMRRRREFFIDLDGPSFVRRLLFSVLILGGVVYLGLKLKLGWLAGPGLILYAAVAWKSRLFSAEDRDLVKSMLKKRKTV